jgi:hypothetical protein
MTGPTTLAILSDIHYASAAEQARGDDYELAGIANPVLRFLVRRYRYHIWMRAPLRQNYLLDKFLAEPMPFDYVVANGDYTCDTVNVGISDDAAFESVRECLERLRGKFGERLRINYGDHELGKVSFFGGRGGMRFASWRRAREELKLEPFWQLSIGRYVLMGVVSSIAGLPVFEADTLPQERVDWERARAEHIQQVRQAFMALEPEQRVLLFCHDPTALPFLGREPEIKAKLSQIEQTIIGHLHSSVILWKSRLLAGMPQLNFLGHTTRRLSSALRRAREWRPFNVRLCPALAGVELFRDGGYLTARLDPAAQSPTKFEFHPLGRER